MDIKSKIFIDGGDPEETRQANEIMLKQFSKPLDGQTTNPTLIAKNLASRVKGKISEAEALSEYKRIVREMSRILPKGSISIQVFANRETKAREMLEQAKDRITWISNASIKFPCTTEGLKAANQACEFTPINITLVFSQAQAGGVYQATLNHKFPVFISPFVGRLDDKGENGMEVVKNILKMYHRPRQLAGGGGDGHVEVLTASIRNVEHIMYALYLSSEILTIPFKVFKLWAEKGFQTPDNNYKYIAFSSGQELKPIVYREDIQLGKDFKEYDLYHDLTIKGIDAFYSDWTGLFNK